jgi:hypothetical protein
MPLTERRLEPIAPAVLGRLEPPGKLRVLVDQRCRARCYERGAASDRSGGPGKEDLHDLTVNRSPLWGADASVTLLGNTLQPLCSGKKSPVVEGCSADVSGLM